MAYTATKTKGNTARVKRAFPVFTSFVTPLLSSFTQETLFEQWFKLKKIIGLTSLTNVQKEKNVEKSQDNQDEIAKKLSKLSKEQQEALLKLLER